MGGSGLLIPSNRAQELMKTIKEHGITSYGWLGVRLQGLDDMTKSAFKVKKGALVSDVVEESPAEKAGVEEGDVITSYDGKEVQDIKDLVEMVGTTKPGKKVNLDVMRKGKKKTLKVKIGERSEGELLSRQWHIEMPAIEDFYTATELFKSAQKKELDAEVKRLKEEMNKLKEELEQLKMKGKGL